MKYEKRMKYFLLLSLIWTNCITIAQNSINRGSYNNLEVRVFYKEISFGDKIDFGNIDSDVRWTIINSKHGINVNLIGNEINSYSFDEYGEYEIHFFEAKKQDGECIHARFAEQMMIKVNPVKLSFDFSKIKFSEKLEKGKEYQNLIITVPVSIRVKENLGTTLSVPAMSVSGIGVSLSAVALNKEIVLKNGIQLLRYKVSGLINRATYLMFDFYDFNNQVQTYNLNQIIN